jgi:hypothetical protein
MASPARRVSGMLGEPFSRWPTSLASHLRRWLAKLGLAVLDFGAGTQPALAAARERCGLSRARLASAAVAIRRVLPVNRWRARRRPPCSCTGRAPGCRQDRCRSCWTAPPVHGVTLHVRPAHLTEYRSGRSWHATRLEPISGRLVPAAAAPPDRRRTATARLPTHPLPPLPGIEVVGQSPVGAGPGAGPNAGNHGGLPLRAVVTLRVRARPGASGFSCNARWYTAK